MPRKANTRSQTKNQSNNIPVGEDEVGDPSVPKENQEPVTVPKIKPPAKRGRKKKNPDGDDQTPAPKVTRGRKKKNQLDDIQQDIPALKATSSAPKATAKRKRNAADNNDAIQEPAGDDILNEDIVIQEAAKPNPIDELLKLSDDDGFSEDGSQFSDESVKNIRREPLALITNNNNRIDNNTIGSYTNVNRIRNTRLDGSNDASKSSRLHLNNTTPRPIPRPTPRSNDSYDTYTRFNDTRSNNAHMRFNDNDDHLNSCPTPRSNTRFDNNGDVSRSNTTNMFRQTLGSNQPTLPVAFGDMTNIHQICSWLCENPSILLLAYNMHLSIQTPITNAFNFTSPNFNSLTSATSMPQMPKHENRTKENRDFLEELKCLFLRVRNPNKSIFEELVRQIYNCDLNSTEGIDLLRVANRNFSDFRNKFLDGIKELIDTFKEKRTLENAHTRPLESDIIMFVDETLTINTLQRWLNATNMTELRAQGSLHTLQRFVQKAFAINYSSRNPDRTKSLDNMTKTMVVPSRNGGNIASNLQL